MKKETNMDGVKSVARWLLHIDLNDTPYSPMIVQHPFTTSGFAGGKKDGEMIMLRIAESKEDLKTWRELLTEQINKAKEPMEIYAMITKPYALTFLKYAADELSRDDFSKILSQAWILSENPNADANVSKKELLSFFKNAKLSVLMDEDEYEQFKQLDDIVTVYRGVTTHNAKNIKALSWTLDYKTAEWFAHRFDEDGTVYEAQIPKQHIYALFNGRNESEVIVDPKYLIDITEAQAMDAGMTMNQ